MSANPRVHQAGLGQRLVTALILAATPLAGLEAQAPGGRLGLHAYVGSNSGGWSRTEESTTPGGSPFRFEFSSGAGAGLRLAFAVTPRIGLWAAGELNVEQETPFAGLYGGVWGRALFSPRLGIQGRLGAGRLDHGPFGLAGATLEWFIVRQLSLGVGGEVLRPIGTGQRHNGLRNVDVEYDGGPNRLLAELGWHLGR